VFSIAGRYNSGFRHLKATSIDGGIPGLPSVRCMRWYNNEHRHGRIPFGTPAVRHRGLDHQDLARRHGFVGLYERNVRPTHLPDPLRFGRWLRGVGRTVVVRADTFSDGAAYGLTSFALPLSRK
jgi:hypothetical protein